MEKLKGPLYAMKTFTSKELEILRQVQGDLPDCAEPFQAVAREAGVEEADVLAFLRTMKEEGNIRRFGATLRHQKAGYQANAMTVWCVENPEERDRAGAVMAQHPAVSHCYARPPADHWPYNLYAMVHGRDRSECFAVAEELKKRTGLAECKVLFSHKELKKTSMEYF